MSDFRLRSVVAIWTRHATALLRTWKVAVTWLVFEPAVILVATGFGIGGIVGDVEPGETYSRFVTPGVILGTAMFHAIFECAWSAFQRIRQSFYETLLTAPVTVGEVVLGEILWGTTRAGLSAIALGALAVGIGWMDAAAFPGVFLAAIAIGVLFSEIGLVFAALSSTIHTLSLVFTVVATPLYFFAGAFFPISVLPGWLQPVAWIAPLTPGVHVARGFARGSMDATHAAAALFLVAAPVALFPFVRSRFSRRLVR